MKKVMCVILLAMCVTGYAQKGGGFGVTGGLNYGSNGDFENGAQAIIEDPSKNVGFHIGFFGKIDLGLLYLRPEAAYTRTKSEYRSGDLSVSKLDVPLLVGIDVLGPITVFAGPSLQYILKNEFEDFDLETAENDFTVGAQLGVGLNFESFGIDVRYERGLSENEVDFSNIPTNRIDTRPEQIILGLSVPF